MDTDEVPNDSVPAFSTNTGDSDTNMQDAKATADADASRAENGVPDLGDKPVQMETDTKVCISNRYITSYWLE